MAYRYIDFNINDTSNIRCTNFFHSKNGRKEATVLFLCLHKIIYDEHLHDLYLR